ncbi:MAG: CvpA family protein [Ruminococcaceae bacterium]|nr:CvpA family protein [Oscillospiraceae bacterium]
MAYLLDLIFIGLAVALIVLAAKKGFIEALLDGFSAIIAGLFAYWFAEPASQFAYNSFVSNSIRNRLSNTLSGSSYEFSTLDESVPLLIEKIPESAINFASKFGFNINAVADSIIKSAPADKDALIETIMTNVTDKVMPQLTEAVTVVLLFIVFTLVLKFVIRLLNGVINRIPVIKETDKIFGAILGAVKAVVIILVVCTVLYFVASSSNDEQLVSIVNSSKIFEFVNNHNPLINIFN